MKNKGITIISLIITIIIMLILVGTTVQVVINSNLINTAQNAGDSYKVAYEDDKDFGGGNIIINGKEYSGIDGFIQNTCEHKWGEWEIIKEAAYEEEGEQKRNCVNCGAEQTQTVPMLACETHTYGEWVVTTAPTCITAGAETKTCTICGATITQSVSATGHNYGEWEITKETTCGEPGSKTRTCSACGTTETETIPATGMHSGATSFYLTTSKVGSVGDTSDYDFGFSCGVCGLSYTETVSYSDVVESGYGNDCPYCNDYHGHGMSRYIIDGHTTVDICNNCNYRERCG